MSLQAFKLHVATSVVNQQNASLSTMNTEQLLDLFELSPSTAQPNTKGTAGAANPAAIDAFGAPVAGSKRRAADGNGGGLRGVLDGVGELWDEGQYDEQFSLDKFLADIR